MRPVEHLRVRHRIGAFLDGELNGATARLVAGHLQDCWTCNDTAHDLRLIRASLTHLGRTAPPTVAAARLRRLAARLGR